MSLTLEELMSTPTSQPMPTNVVSIQQHGAYRILEQELTAPVSTGHDAIQVGWEQVLVDGQNQYQYVVALVRNRILFAKMRQLGARRDTQRKVWLISMSKRDLLKDVISRHRDLLGYLADDEKLKRKQAAAVLLESRQERLEEANHRLTGLFEVAAFLRQHGRSAKVKEMGALDGRRSLYYLQHTAVGHKDQVLAYDYVLNRVWWCAGTHPDSFASWLPCEGAQSVLAFFECYHHEILLSVKIPTEAQLTLWRSLHQERLYD